MIDRPCVIAIDYDHTWTRDPEVWKAIVIILQSRGHKVILLTGRSGALEEPARQAVEGIVDGMVFAGHVWKREAAKKQGWDVDIFIDDMPEYIGPQNIITTNYYTK